LSRARGGHQRVRDPNASSSNACYYCRKSEHIKKNYMKYKEMLKKKGDKDSDGANTSRKSNKQVPVMF